MKTKFIILLSVIATHVYPYNYEYAFVVEFTDKNNSEYSVTKPNQFLSDRAISRRLKYNIAVVEQDLPVNKNYTDSISKYNAEIHVSSKWLNSSVFYTHNPDFATLVSNISFVKKVTKVFDSNYILNLKLARSKYHISNAETALNYGLSMEQILLSKGEALHTAGFTGGGYHIAIIDAGFPGADTIQYFEHIFNSCRLLGTYNFVQNTANVYADIQHGTNVFSIIGAGNDGILYGTSPNASFYLLTTEDDKSEFPIEEENWIAALEYADSAGVDVINTSLGYDQMDDPSMSHSYTTMNGITNRSSVAADIAFSKGMILVTSAGNSDWDRIGTPADAVNTLSVGAVKNDGTVTNFSSRGPSYDGRIKPDVCALGYDVYVVNSIGEITKGDGTSFAAPVITGLVTCLWQYMPNKTNLEITEAVRKSGSHYQNPDESFGYGIANFQKAMGILDGSIDVDETTASVNKIEVYPNPFYNSLNIKCSSTEHEYINVEILTSNGELLFMNKYQNKNGRVKILGLDYLNTGIYFVKVITNNNIDTYKILKL